jgi:segregation and condensation protein B
VNTWTGSIPRSRRAITRATLETLAIIAYRQRSPRGHGRHPRRHDQHADPQAARGPGLGRSDRPSRGTGPPALFATTRQFLDDLGLASLDQLPILENPAVQARALAALSGDGDPQAGLAIDAAPDAPDGAAGPSLSEPGVTAAEHTAKAALT